MLNSWSPQEQERSKTRRDYFREYARNRNYATLKDGTRIRNQKWSAQLRIKVIEKLGGKCKDCGFNDPRALQIDHVNNDGYIERNLITSRVTYLNKVLKDTSGKYQLLCANCNWIKRYNNNMIKRGGVK
jgi:hypothetical protein